MSIEYDPEKRLSTVMRRGPDMADTGTVFAGPHKTSPDIRRDYGEDRFITIGYIGTRMVVLVWTWRGENRRIISLRKANGREQRAGDESFAG